MPSMKTPWHDPFWRTQNAIEEFRETTAWYWVNDHFEKLSAEAARLLAKYGNARLKEFRPATEEEAKQLSHQA